MRKEEVKLDIILEYLREERYGRLKEKECARLQYGQGQLGTSVMVTHLRKLKE